MTLLTHSSGSRDAEAALAAIRNFDSEGVTIKSDRNVIKVIDTPAGQVNVKAFKVPSLLNRIVYTFLRKPKGLRAYIYPQEMHRRGVATPEALAYVEERRGGLIARSWLATRQCGLTRRMYEFGDKAMDNPADREIVAAFARFTARMHDAGVLHLDYSPGNILFDNVNGQWQFSTVDVNRLRFGKVSMARGCANFARLWGQPEMFRIIAREYAAARGFDAQACLKAISAARTRFWRRFSSRHPLKYTYRPIDLE